MTTVRVSASRSYDILIGEGLMGDVGAQMAARFKSCRVCVIADDTVAALYAGGVTASLRAAGFDVSLFTFPHGEAQKTLLTLSDMLEFMAGERLSRTDMVLALGGGVVGDMAGFAASVYARGIRFVQVPTTLLAAVDSSVGGKTAVNLRAGKNMAGVFAQPSLVVCDTGVIRALPKALLPDGAAEIIKYGLLSDPELFGWMRRGELMERLDEIVARCVTIKRDIVNEDEFDTGLRQTLNLGHTLGHAVEKCSGFTISHGRGVAIGMALIARAAAKKGYLADGAVIGALREALEANELPSSSPYGADELYDAALLDKKRASGAITLVVPREVGRCDLVKVPLDELKGWIDAGVTA